MLVETPEPLVDIKPPPPDNTYLTNDEIINGSQISDIDRVKIMSSEEFELFTREWVHGYLKEKYQQVKRAGGAGDKGRDVIATIDASQKKWDNYQCKHYDHALRPSDIWVELGKLCYYTYTADYSVPQNYYFISPRDLGTSLYDLITQNTREICRELIKNWEKYCKTKITQNSSVDLSPDFMQYIENFNFGILKYISIQTIIDQHKTTPYGSKRFGGGLKKRLRVNFDPILTIVSSN